VNRVFFYHAMRYEICLWMQCEQLLGVAGTPYIITLVTLTTCSYEDRNKPRFCSFLYVADAVATAAVRLV